MVGKDSGAVEKSKHKLKKTVAKRSDAAESSVRDDSPLEISTTDIMTLTKPEGKAKENLGNSSKPVDGDDSDENSEVEQQEKALLNKGKRTGKDAAAFKQRDLVALAFAGDNVVQVSINTLYELNGI